MLSELKTYSTVKLFFIYCLFLVAITYLVQSFLITSNVLHYSYGEQLSYERIEEMIAGQNKWSWLSYTLLPLIFLLKFFLVACCLLTGAIFLDVKLGFSKAFKAALLADVVFIVPMVLKIAWFMFVRTSYTLQDLQNFYPLSLLNFFDVKQIGTLWLYPLQTMNVFELLYIFSLGFWLYQFGAKSLDKGLKVVFAGYLPALFTWIILVMFVTVNLSQDV
jgi:hypothetical protein